MHGAAIRCGVVVLLLLAHEAGTVFGRALRLEFCPVAPGAEFDERLELRIEGEPARLQFYRNSIHRYRHFMDTSRIRLAADGPVNVELAVRDKAVTDARLGALGRDIDLAYKGSNLSFRLPGPGHYYLQLPELAKPYGTCTVLFWVDDLDELRRNRIRPTDPGVVDITANGVTSDPQKDQTEAIQSILDKGGTVYFAPGIYRAGTLNVPSNTTVYMAAGSLLKAVDDESALKAEFIRIENADDVRIIGRGTIDANGGIAGWHNVHNVNIIAAKNVLFRDVLFQNSNSWAVHIRTSDRFSARNVKVFSGKDGFDPDSSRDVLLDTVFVVSIDDAVAVKNRYPDDPNGRTTERVMIRDSIVSSMKSSLKVGTETRGPIRDVTFENCDVYDGERGIVLYARDGGPVERITWRNIRMSMIDWVDEKNSGRAFHLNIDYRSESSRRPTPVRDCMVENITANVLYPSELGGLADAPLDGLEMRNITLRVDRPKDGDRHFLFECLTNVDIRLLGLKVDWQGHRNLWHGISAGGGLTVLPFSVSGPSTRRSEKGDPARQ